MNGMINLYQVFKKTQEVQGMSHSKEKSPENQKSSVFVDQESRRKMVEETAYFLSSSKEDFRNDPTAAWLAAEKEVDNKLGEQEGRLKEELAVFEHLRKELGKILTNVTRTVQKDTFKQAMDEAVQKVKQQGKFTAETINKGAEAVQKDVAHTIEKLGGTWHSVSVKTTDYFSTWGKRSVSFLKQAETEANQWLKQISKKMSRQVYHSGEITSEGTFLCKSCGHSFKQEKTGHLPLCPSCGEKEFKLGD
jgi:rubrerythrin